MSDTTDRKTILITGGSRGIGRALVEDQVSRGNNVIYTFANSLETAEAFLEEVRKKTEEGQFVECSHFDAKSDQHDTDKFFAETLDQYGPIFGLVNNVGIIQDRIMLRMREEDWMNVINVNLNSVYRMCKASVKPFFRQGSGSIVNVSSISGKRGEPGQAAYAAAKAGIIGFTQSFAAEIGVKGVRVNAIAPGFTKTSMTEKIKYDDPRVLMSALQRMGDPSEIAKAANFLLSDESSFVTGETLVVDGGLLRM